MAIRRKKSVTKIRIKLWLYADPHVKYPGEAAETYGKYIDAKSRDLRSTVDMTVEPDAVQWEIRALSKTQYEGVYASATDGNAVLFGAAELGATPLVDLGDDEELLISRAEAAEVGGYVLALSEGRGLAPAPLAE